MKKQIKDNRVLISTIVGLAVVFGGIISVKAISGFSWGSVENKVVDKLVSQISPPNLEESDLGEGMLGSATVARKGSSARQAGGSMDSTTSTFAYWQNNTGRTVIVDKISLAFDADDGIFKEKASPVLIVATSTVGGATSTLNSDLLNQIFTTSTAVQFISTSTFTNAWQRWVANGEYVVFGWSELMGASSTWASKNTPSSTGSWAIDYFLK